VVFKPLINAKKMIIEKNLARYQPLYDPIPVSLHFPLMIFAFSPLILIVYLFKKRREKIKLIRED